MPQKQLEYWFTESIKDSQFENHYELGREIGRGSTATVYHCTHKGTGQAWAVKILDKRVEHRHVGAEIGILLRLDHPNIIRLKEVYETQRHIFIVLELVTGSDLFDRIVTEEFYSEEQAARAVRDIITAVEYLHKNNIAHRDLKPENVLYESPFQDSKLKIADFGLSTIISDKIAMTTVCGTPGYCAPEVLKGSQYYSSCDMWSIGVIVYIMLCGYEPFYDEKESAMFKKILKGDFLFDSPWWDDVSENAKDLVRKLLVVDAKKRLTASAALKHVWVTGLANKKVHKEETVKKMKEFNARRKLKFATDAILLVAATTRKMTFDRITRDSDTTRSHPDE